MQRHSRLVLCRCKSHCTTRNLITGLYEGQGHSISRSTRDAHARDDQLQHALIMENPGSASTRGRRNNWVDVYHAELKVLRTLPVTSRRTPLVFRNSPALSGPFIVPTDHEMTTANHGVHALTNDPANQAFLRIEARYCEYSHPLRIWIQQKKQQIYWIHCIWNCDNLQERKRYNGTSSAPL